MQELIARVTAATGLDAARAEKAIGIIIHLIRTQGDKAKAAALLAKLPGAAALADRHGGDAGNPGGLMGLLGGGLMGGPLMAISKLQAAGLSMDQIKLMGTEVLGYAKEKAGPELVRDLAGSIPGLSAYV